MAMKDKDASQSSILSFGKRVRKEQPDSGEEKDGEDGYREARARAREAPMLDVVFTDGRIESFDYSLPKRVTFLPEGRLILRFGGDSIVVEGANLARVREQIVEGRRRFIRVGTEAEEGIKPEDAPHIEKIEITEADS
jgi:hypothetical protein